MAATAGAIEHGLLDIAAAADIGAAYDTAVSTVPTTSGAEMAFVGLPDGPEQIVLGHSVHARTKALDGVQIPAGWGLGGKVLASQRPHWVPDYPNARNITHIGRVDAAVAGEGLHAILGVPMVHDGAFLGVLYAGNHDVTDFGDRSIDALIESAKRAAFAIALARKAEAGRVAAITAERRRIAIGLHHSVDSALSAFGAAARRLASDPTLDPRVRWRLTALERQAADASATLRLALRELGRERRNPNTALGLTARELDVLRRVALGERNAEVAAAVHLAPNTVKSYLQSACQKLGARNRVEAVGRAEAAGLL